jgi:D-alanine-D-alanine ligase
MQPPSYQSQPANLNAHRVQQTPPWEEEALARLALQAFSSLGCSVWGRVDLMRDADGSFNLLEVNTIPGMTSHSLVPMAAAALGIGLPELIGSIACLSLYGGEA